MARKKVTKKKTRTTNKTGIIMFKNKCLKDCHTKYLKKYSKGKNNQTNFFKDSNKYSVCVKNCEQTGGEKIKRNKRNVKRNLRSKKRVKRTNKMKSYKMNISEDKYQKLLSKKRLSKKEKKTLDKSLHLKYCNCIKSLKYGDKNPGAYGICANSVYKNRGLELPYRAARNCKKFD